MRSVTDKAGDDEIWRSASAATSGSESQLPARPRLPDSLPSKDRWECRDEAISNHQGPHLLSTCSHLPSVPVPISSEMRSHN